MNSGARAQRLLWASTGAKDPRVSETLYVEELAAPFTVNTMPEATLRVFAAHGTIGEILSERACNCEQTLADFAQAGIDVNALAAQLQDEGTRAFVRSWKDLLDCIASRSEMLTAV